MRESNIRVPGTPEYFAMPCRCCSATKVRLVIDLGDQPEANRLVRPETPAGSEPSYPLRFGYCEACSMMQIDHTIPRDLMYQGNVYVSGTSKTLPKHFADTTARLIETYDIVPTDLVVDIGSNDGTWIKTWANRARALGVEPDVRIADFANDTGARTLCKYFDMETAREIKEAPGPAKLITSNGSFFHMEDIHGACEGVRHLMRDDGVFIVQALSGEHMLRDTAFDQILHEHLMYYTPESFSHLMSLHGMEVFYYQFVSIQGGSMEYHVGLPGRHKRKFIPNRISVGMVSCEAFARRVLTLRDDLLTVLRLYHDAGKSVWSYGAPGKATTLFNSFGIGTDLVQCAVEKNPLKFGLDIPGCRIPVVEEGTVRPHAYLVTAWNFLGEFVAKEAAWLESGGEFVVPVPSVRVIGRDGMDKIAGQKAPAGTEWQASA